MTAAALLLAAGGGALTAAAVWAVSDRASLALLRAFSRRVLVRWASGAAARKKGALDGLRGGLRDGLAGAAGGASRGLRAVRERRERADRKARCLSELPELIDVVVLGLSVGVSFDASLRMYCSRNRTMLSELLGDAMRSWRLGIATRREALAKVSAELGVGAFDAFVETVTESLDFGSPLVESLVNQAESVRRQRRMSLEEQVEKAPVKMLIPTGTLVLPAMLLAILGPLLASLASVTGG